jgi:alpha-N-arabinofuranosidase
MASMTTQYDNYNRSWPDVFVGEYAANGDRKPNLQAGLAEAAFLLGFEHNADKVTASSFAPLLTHIESTATQWDYDLIVFNATSLFALPSYDVQCMLSNASHGYTVPLNVTGKGGQVFRAGQTRFPRMQMDVF